MEKNMEATVGSLAWTVYRNILLFGSRFYILSRSGFFLSFFRGLMCWVVSLCFDSLCS